MKINVPAIIASEKMLENKHITNFSQFKLYIESIGLKNVEFTKPLGYVGIGFVDYCFLGGEDLIKMDDDIHKILFKNIEPRYKDFCLKRGIDGKQIDPKWRNSKIDVLIMWCHIYYEKDILITRDRNFKRHENDLSKFFSKKIEIMGPEKCISYFLKL